MPLIPTEDGAYTFAIDDHGDTRNGIPQWVVYRGNPALGHVVADRHSYEARHAPSPHPAPFPPDTHPLPPQQPPGAPALPGGQPRVIQVTTEADGAFHPRMYSYWSNAWVSGGTIFVFAGHVDSGGPVFFGVDERSGHVTHLGSLRMPYGGTTEGWSWGQNGWIFLCDGQRYRRVNPFTGEDLIIYDISVSHPGCQLWQPHSSHDGLTHSATVQQIVSDGAYPKLGTVVCRHGKQEYFPAEKSLDESALTSDGAFLIMKEGDDNRIIELATRETRWLRDEDGALGHSDCGDGFMVGEANLPEPGCCCLWDLRQPLTLARRRVLFESWNVGYIAVRGNRCLHSGDTHLSLVDVHTGAVTPLVAHGGSSDYDSRVKASLSPCAMVASYMSGGIVYLLVMP